MTETQIAIEDVLWGVRRSQRYHMARVRFFTSFERVISWLSVLSGTAVAATIIAASPSWVSLSFAGLITALQSIDLVVGIGASARLHSDLHRRFVVLERDHLSYGLSAPELSIRRLEIEADEPPILRWLDLLCHNELSRSMFGDDASVYKIGWWPRRFAQWFDLGQVKLERA